MSLADLLLCPCCGEEMTGFCELCEGLYCETCDEICCQPETDLITLLALGPVGQVKKST